ncbi:MAG: hypothetical protein QNK04_22620 [Myxococcota bacterium]|nr:hypothetical protein [Myxococcota bacterium]
MAEVQPDQGGEEGEGPAATPFDNPYFLPVLLWLFAAWFFWDAWIQPLEEWLRFNRYGFGFLLGLAVHGTIQAVRPVPYLFAALMLAYAAWLATLGFVLGAEDAWYSNDKWAVLFNRWGSGAFVFFAAVSALRETLRLRSAEDAPAQ